MRGDRKTGTYYWLYSLWMANGKRGKTRYSRNFKTLEEAKKFRDEKGFNWFSGRLYFSESIIHDRVVNI